MEKSVLIVGEWAVDSDTNSIRRRAEVRQLQPLSINILVYLAEHADRVVTNDELITKFWPGRVVGDDAVHRRIANLRKLLDDDARDPHYISTVSKRGYRMIADVRITAEVTPSASRVRLTPVRAVALILVVAALLLLVYAQRAVQQRDSLSAAIAAAQAMLAEDDYQQAFVHLEPFLQETSSEPLQSLLDRILIPVSVRTEPAGVEIAYRFPGTDAGWRSMGITPIDQYDLPRGNYKLRVGDDVLLDVTNPGVTFNSAGRSERVIQLPTEPIPSGMSFIPAGEYRLGAWGFIDDFDLGAFFIDRFEVSNHDYQAFVDVGGYREPSYWQELIDTSAGKLTWEIVSNNFVDQTGRPGPAFWELGSYPPGEQSMPVVGISWYEANAYLKFADKTLPNVHHWLRTALGPMEWKYPFASELVPHSNIGADRLLPVDRQSNAEVNGTFDMIGNAAEWTTLDNRGSKAVIGASYRDPPWAYNFPQPRDPMQRLDHTGFRGMRATRDSVDRPLPDFPLFNDFSKSIRRVSDGEFAGMKHSFDYPAGTLNAQGVVVVDNIETDYWVRREVLLPTGRPDDPLPVFLYIPQRFDPPYQSVIYLPPADSWSPGFDSDSIRIENYQVDFVPRSGRVLVWPVYSGSNERYDNYHADSGAERTSLALERNRRVRDEVGRVLDYLGHGDEFDETRVALMALSYGATLAPFVLATESRIKAAVIYSAGIAPPIPVFANPQNDPNVFWARVRQPVLLVNGRYDPIRPHQFVLGPLLELLATPPEDKKLILYDSGHWPLPRHLMMRDSLEWLDRHLGAVEPPRRDN